MENESETARDMLLAKATRMAALVKYQEKAVVSRTLIDKDAGTVTLFAFDENQGLSEHTAPYDAMILVLEGEAEVLIEGKPVRLKKGEITIMPASKPHAVKAVSKFKMLLVMIRE
ncbi:MAG TPA: cupin domain-containing protein [Candidatus Bathyarchaeia archaeon]|nr:cupin domain-containing protein [Candidatus Bathyarchaeia archaeon]